MDAGIVSPGNIGAKAAPCLEFSACLSRLWRADERTRTADLKPHYECDLEGSPEFMAVRKPAYLSRSRHGRTSLSFPVSAGTGLLAVLQ
jgi:hypothetical protein